MIQAKAFPPKTGTTVARSIVQSAPDATPHLTYFNCTSDKAASVIKALAGVNSHVVQVAALSTATTLTLDNVDQLADADVLIIEPAGGVAPFVATIASSGVNPTTKVVTFTGQLGAAVGKGSKVWRTRSMGQIPVGAATKELGPLPYPGAILLGQNGAPLMLELDGTSACRIDAATAIVA